jgi:hypothetical protein
MNSFNKNSNLVKKLKSHWVISSNQYLILCNIRFYQNFKKMQKINIKIKIINNAIKSLKEDLRN